MKTTLLLLAALLISNSTARADDQALGVGADGPTLPFFVTNSDGSRPNVANFGATESAFNGGLGIGQDANACTTSNAGTLRYDPASHSMQYCNSTAWTGFDGIVASSYGNPGYVQFADGWVHEWGYIIVNPDAAPTGGFAEWLPAFPLPFPHGVYSTSVTTADGLNCFTTGADLYNNYNLLIAVGHECGSSSAMAIFWTADGN